MGSFQFIGKLFSLAATSICSVATVASIRALSPLLIVACYKLYYNVHFGVETYLSLCPLLLGVIFIVYSQSLPHDTGIGELEKTGNAASAAEAASSAHSTVNNSSDIRGMSLAFLAALIFAIQNIYAKNVVTHGSMRSSHNGDLALRSDNPNSPNASNNNSRENLLDQSQQSQQSQPKRTTTTDFNLLEKGPMSPISMSLNNMTPQEINKKDMSEQSMNNSTGSMSPYALQEDKPAKMTTLIYCAMFGFLLSIPTLLLYEIWDLSSHWNELPIFWLLINGFGHFIQSLLAFQILSMYEFL
ncbi:unnamed protein product [Ambrosiozyma monospora]|uniref:Unnamed protein product n=1 Tax=Ambrosiozyma monospora TaxID=43982 RepID=A0ACB5U735_AMBMO|nr:unnamed protein product [Ambrosiozyma monospora]